MKINKYQLYSRIFLVLSCLLFLAFTVSFILILCSQQNLEFSPDSKGLKLLIDIYSPSLQIGAVAIAFFTLWLTLERTRQTDERVKQTNRQIEITKDDVKFNNFFKHNEEFRIYLKKLTFFKVIERINNVDVDVLTMPLYYYYFNNNHRDFKPNLNLTAKNEISAFISEIIKSPLCLQNQDLGKIPLDQIKKLFSLINPLINELCNIYTDHEIVDVRKDCIGGGARPIELLEERYRMLNNLYWATSLCESFLAFDGFIQSESEMFSINYGVYRKGIGLE